MKIWGPKSEKKITNWNQVDPSFPDEPLTLAGPGTDSGTFDYFTDAINGEEGASRADYNASEDDNVIVQAVAGEKGGARLPRLHVLRGEHGHAQGPRGRQRQRLRRPERRDGAGRLLRTASRPLFIYVKTESIQTKPEVAGFVDYYLNNVISLAEGAQFIPVTDDVVEREPLRRSQTQEG